MLESIIFDELTTTSLRGSVHQTEEGESSQINLFESIVGTELRHELISLSKDPVSNIRVSFAEIF